MIERIIVGDLRTNCYFFSFNKKECVIIDPGADPLKIIAAIEILNIIPVGIVFTHGHFDHTMAALTIREHFKKKRINIKIAIHNADRTYLGRGAERNNRKQVSVLGRETVRLFNRIFEKLPEPDVLLKEGNDVFKSGLKVIETPGHTAGSICLYSKRESILFTGDTLIFGSIGRTDIPGGNYKVLLKSIREKILVLPPETNIFPGHGPTTTIEREIKGNSALRGDENAEAENPARRKKAVKKSDKTKSARGNLERQKSAKPKAVMKKGDKKKSRKKIQGKAGFRRKA